MNMKFFFKLVMMLAALFAVIYMMKGLRSPEFTQSGTVSALLGTDAKPFNWCGTANVQVELRSSNPSVSATKQLSKVDSARICEILIEPVSQDDLATDYAPVAQVIPQAGDKEVVILEQNSKGVFRVKDLPFRSTSLTKVLSELR